jgi:hypothetical protein
VRFIFEPDRASPNGITYAWLIHKTYNGKEKAATAARAFWLPFAYQDAGNYSEAELRDLAQQSIWQMEAQIQHLRESFGLGTVPTNADSKEQAVAPGIASPSTEDMTPAVVPPVQAQSIKVISQDLDLLNEFADVL